MNNTNQERYLRNFIMALTAVVLLFVVLPAQADTCENAHRDACEDLIGAEVTFEKVGHITFSKVCSNNAAACAVVNISAKQCTIYYKTRTIDATLLNHELNHCRGWFHKGHGKKANRRPWVDYQTHIGE